MPVKPGHYYYFDSALFVAYISQEPGRADVIDALWSRISGSPQNRVVTSILATVEVAFAGQEKAHKALDPEGETRIDTMWADPSILLIETNMAITKLARTLMRELLRDPATRLWVLKPYDATHLATAMWIHQNVHQIEKIYTYDDKLYKLSSIVGIAIEKPTVTTATQTRF